MILSASRTALHLLNIPLLLSTLTEKYNFLGISIVGQSNERGDGGIYIGSIMKGGAVAADGRIEPGDMLLQVRRWQNDDLGIINPNVLRFNVYQFNILKGE